MSVELQSVHNYLADGQRIEDLLGYWSTIDGCQTFKLVKLMNAHRCEVN